jgi:hypothetical protein
VKKKKRGFIVRLDPILFTSKEAADRLTQQGVELRKRKRFYLLASIVGFVVMGCVEAAIFLYGRPASVLDIIQATLTGFFVGSYFRYKRRLFHWLIVYECYKEALEMFYKKNTDHQPLHTSV